jgi:aminoglycoside phosphotransferase
VDLVGYEWDPWWHNDEEGTVVHRLTAPDRTTLFVKEAPAATLAAEHQRMAWCAGRLPVPEIVSFDGARLVTVALPGAGAHDRMATPDTAIAVGVLAEAWRLVHAVPVGDCPFDSTTATMLDRAGAHADVRPYDVWDPFAGRHRAAATVIAELVAGEPDPLGPVVIHGDTAVPNALVADGRLTGIVDLAALGVGDPWFDLSACLGSMGRPDNGLAHERDRFLDAYGAEPDAERERWFRLLYRLHFDAPLGG